ncbi:hypothetical protein [Streptomyces sp. NPDC001781]
MSLTSSGRVPAVVGPVLLAIGLGASGYGSVRDDLAMSLGGLSAVFAAMSLIALIRVRAWIINTSRERAELASARQAAEREQRRYFALQAALEGEQSRLTKDVAAERAANTARLAAEREAMEAEFEERRLQVQKDAFRCGVEMERSGALKPEPTAPAAANLIPFPKQPLPGPQLGRELSREHDAVEPRTPVRR